jgi:chemotaxis protein CheX
MSTVPILSFMDTCVTDVFSKMLGLQAQPGPGLELAARPSSHRGVTGSIGLTGKFTGVVFTNFSDSFARLITVRILGSDSVGDGEVTDVVGEITNMISGNLKSRMCDSGYNCQLSIPTVMRGEVTVDARHVPSLVRNEYLFAEVAETLTLHVFARLND